MPKKAGPGSLQGIIARNVGRLRRERKISQEELAHICGYHRTYVGMIERGERNISIATLEALAGALGVEAVRLLEKAEPARPV
jgi:transcriptional regulator with XRE-family HTH domain